VHTVKVARAGLILLLVCGVFAGALAAQRSPRGRWIYLGKAHVDGTTDHDKIKVTSSEGEFRSIQIHVDYAPIEFNRVVVHYGNGGDDEIEVRDRVPAGAQTRVIDLRGERRVIQSVEVWYEKARWESRRPRIRLYGRR